MPEASPPGPRRALTSPRRATADTHTDWDPEPNGSRPGVRRRPMGLRLRHDNLARMTQLSRSTELRPRSDPHPSQGEASDAARGTPRSTEGPPTELDADRGALRRGSLRFLDDQRGTALPAPRRRGEPDRIPHRHRRCGGHVALGRRRHSDGHTDSCGSRDPRVFRDGALQLGRPSCFRPGRTRWIDSTRSFRS